MTKDFKLLYQPLVTVIVAVLNSSATLHLLAHGPSCAAHGCRALCRRLCCPIFRAGAVWAFELCRQLCRAVYGAGHSGAGWHYGAGAGQDPGAQG